MIGDTFRIVEATMIISFLFRVLSLTAHFSFEQVLYELSITIMSYFFTGKKSNIALNIIASTSLTYLCLPSFQSKFRLYFHLRGILRELSVSLNDLKWIPNWKYLNFIYNFLRYSFLEYLFIGFMIMNYKLYTWGTNNQYPLPQDYQIYYQMFVTASTIGYGDVTPKSRNQMVYFTLSIPTICFSFAVYLNHISQIFTQTFLTDDAPQENIQKITQIQVIEPIQAKTQQLSTLRRSVGTPLIDLQQYLGKYLGSQQLNNIINYSVQKDRKIRMRKQDQDRILQNLNLKDDQAIKSAINIKKYNSFIKMIFTNRSTNQRLDRALANSVQEIYYPAGTIILSGFEKNDNLMYIAEGEVRVLGNPNEKQGSTKTNILFNQRGFYLGQISRLAYKTETFTTILALDSKKIKGLFKQNYELRLSFFNEIDRLLATQIDQLSKCQKKLSLKTNKRQKINRQYKALKKIYKMEQTRQFTEHKDNISTSYIVDKLVKEISILIK